MNKREQTTHAPCFGQASDLDEEGHPGQGEEGSDSPVQVKNKVLAGGKMRGCPAEALVFMGRSYFAAITASISEIGTTPPCPPAIRAGAMPRCLSAS